MLGRDRSDNIGIRTREVLVRQLPDASEGFLLRGAVRLCNGGLFRLGGLLDLVGLLRHRRLFWLGGLFGHRRLLGLGDGDLGLLLPLLGAVEPLLDRGQCVLLGQWL